VNDTTVEAGRGRQGRRRPSGEPPPLPREDRWTRWIWVLAAVLLVGAGLNILIHTTDTVQRMDQAVLDWFARVRTPALTDAAKLVALLTTFAAVMVLRIATVLVLVRYRRFRHLVVFLVTLVVTDWVVSGCCSSSFRVPPSRSWSTWMAMRSPPRPSLPSRSRCTR
jgi:hypothetical protein